MSDIFWGAIIGVAGTLVGVIATGIITYINQKKEREARLKELTIQIKHQENELRRNRLIEERKPYLPKLKEAVIDWKTQLTEFISKIDSIGHARIEYNKKSFLAHYFERSSFKKYDEELEKIKLKMDMLKQNVEKLRGHTCDVKLGELVDNVLFKETEVSVVSWPILHLLFEGNISFKKFIDEIQEALGNIRKTTFNLRKDLQLVSKRIEELSIGDESSN